MKRHARRIASMICALAMLTAMMPSAVWAETPVPETTVITEEASTPTATPAATDSTEQPADNSGETPVASPLPTDQEQPATATDTGDAQPAETPAASPAPTATTGRRRGRHHRHHCSRRNGRTCGKNPRTQYCSWWQRK